MRIEFMRIRTPWDRPPWQSSHTVGYVGLLVYVYVLRCQLLVSNEPTSV